MDYSETHTIHVLCISDLDDLFAFYYQEQEAIYIPWNRPYLGGITVHLSTSNAITFNTTNIIHEYYNTKFTS